ncbi:MAG: tetratricopeptide repeat protein [Bdellovibrionales bacterium]
MSYSELIQDCESMLRLGNGGAVSQKLRGISVHRIPRGTRLRLANIARRAGDWPQGLRLLRPVVYPKHRMEPASPGERAEYAALLLRAGSLAEAITSLKTIDPRQVPDASLFLAYAHIGKWEYAEAVSKLTEYLGLHPQPYSAFVAKVNLSSALISIERFDEAKDLLDKSIIDANQLGFTRLLGNCYELRSQVHFHQGRLSSCRDDLENATKTFGGQGTLDRLFIDKWKAVLAATSTGSIEQLLAFRQHSINNNYWEGVREADFHLLKTSFDLERCSHLFFGTPYGFYRQRLRTAFPFFQPSDCFYLNGGCENYFDLETAEFSSGEKLSSGKGVHKLIVNLARDLYRPLRVGELFSELFPNEHFDIDSSPNRIRQLVWRTRAELNRHRSGIQIVRTSGLYALRLSGPAGIRIPLHISKTDGSYRQLRILSRTFEGRHFSARQASESLDISLATAQRLLLNAIDRGEIIKIGQGNKVHYEFALQCPPVAS